MVTLYCSFSCLTCCKCFPTGSTMETSSQRNSNLFCIKLYNFFEEISTFCCKLCFTWIDLIHSSWVIIIKLCWVSQFDIEHLFRNISLVLMRLLELCWKFLICSFLSNKLGKKGSRDHRLTAMYLHSVCDWKDSRSCLWKETTTTSTTRTTLLSPVYLCQTVWLAWPPFTFRLIALDFIIVFEF